MTEQELRETLHTHEFTRSLAMKSKSRQTEYLRSRFLIHKLMQGDHEISNDPSGFIVWPPGTIGSLTHKGGLIGLSLNSALDFRGVGIDLEDMTRVHLGLESRIVQAVESHLIRQLNARWPHISLEVWLAVIFSFKESIFKCLYPIGRIFFSFHKAEVYSIDLERSEIKAIVLDDVCPFAPKGTRIHGHFVFVHDDILKWVLTTVSLDN